MNKRLKELRKTLKLTQEEFGKRIGSVQNTITGYESGRRTPSDPVIFSICREFNVNENWLRTGEGQMFLEINEDSFAKAAALLSDDIFIKSLLIEYLKLDEDKRKLFKDFVLKLSDSMRQMD